MARISVSTLSPPPPPAHWALRASFPADMPRAVDAVPVEPVAYGAFWQRCIAHVIDTMVVGLPIGIIYGSSLLSLIIDIEGEALSIAVIDREMVEGIGFVGILSWLAYCLYEAVMTSSPWAATFGKRALGVRVVRSDGNSMGFARACLRFLAKSLITPLATLGLGYLTAAINPQRRAVHDILADTVVIRET